MPSTDKDNDLLYWVTKDLNEENIKKIRDQWKKEGKLLDIETPFGTLSIMKHPLLNDNEIKTLEDE